MFPVYIPCNFNDLFDVYVLFQISHGNMSLLTTFTAIQSKKRTLSNVMEFKRKRSSDISETFRAKNST